MRYTYYKILKIIIDSRSRPIILNIKPSNRAVTESSYSQTKLWLTRLEFVYRVEFEQGTVSV